MNREILVATTLQGSAVFLVVWAVLRFARGIPANTKAWIWRLAFLKPMVALLPFAAVALHVLPTEKAGTISVVARTAETVSIVSADPARTMDPILILWLTGALLLAVHGLWSRVRIAQMIRRARPFEHTNTGNLRVVVSAETNTPLLVGSLKPTVILPVEALDASDIQLMLAHEQAHLQRRDLAWLALVWVVQTLFFFNPIVWLAARSARLAHESATDELAANLANVPVQTYAEMLLRATVVARAPSGQTPIGVLPMSESYRSIHRRLEAMKYFESKPSLGRRAAIAGLALAVVGMLPLYQLTEAAQKPKDPTGKPPASADIKPSADPSVVHKALHKGAKSKSKTSKSADRLASSTKVMPAPNDPFSKNSSADVRPKSASPDLNVFDKASNTKRGLDQFTTDAKPAANAPMPNSSASSADNNIKQAANAAQPKSSSSDLPVKNAKPANPSDIPFSSTNNSTSQPSATASSDGNVIIDVRLENANIQEALKVMFGAAKKNYVVDSTVTGFVTVSIKEAPFDTCLAAVLKAVKATYREEGGIYQISMAQ